MSRVIAFFQEIFPSLLNHHLIIVFLQIPSNDALLRIFCKVDSEKLLDKADKDYR